MKEVTSLQCHPDEVHCMTENMQFSINSYWLELRKINFSKTVQKTKVKQLMAKPPSLTVAT